MDHFPVRFVFDENCPQDKAFFLDLSEVRKAIRGLDGHERLETIDEYAERLVREGKGGVIRLGEPQ